MSKLPDEFFRRHPDEAKARGATAPETTSDTTGAARPEGRPAPPKTIPKRVAAVVTLLALLVGFLLGRQLLMPREVPPTANRAASPVPSASSASPTATGNPAVGLYDGPTRAVTPRTASGTCQDADEYAPFDPREHAVWRCEGTGVGEHLEFDFSVEQTFVGLRITTGNAANPDSTAGQYQITGVRWTFSDGSTFEQGLPGRNGAVQEIAFPPVEAHTVELEILTTSAPNNNADAVTIGQLQFLAPL